MQIINGSQFPTKVIPLIDSAKKSIKIVVFDWRWYPNDPDNPVQIFNQALVRAVRHGVKIQAVANFDALISTLNSLGIFAKKLIAKNLVHAKLMIIDDSIVILGSHNYTQSAFTMNQEISVVLEELSASSVDEFNRFFNSLYNQNG